MKRINENDKTQVRSMYVPASIEVMHISSRRVICLSETGDIEDMIIDGETEL